MVSKYNPLRAIKRKSKTGNWAMWLSTDKWMNIIMGYRYYGVFASATKENYMIYKKTNKQTDRHGDHHVK